MHVPSLESARFRDTTARLLPPALAAYLVLAAACSAQTAGSSGAATHRISEVQGNGPASPLDKQIVTVQGIVTGFLEASAGRDGFYLQEEEVDTDDDPGTSEGLYIYAPGHAGAAMLRLGQRVTVRGTVKEFNGLTEIEKVSDLEAGPVVPLPKPQPVELPVDSLAALEALEGMRVVFPQTLTVTGVERLGQYGELILAAGGRLFQPTHTVDPNDQPASGTRSSGAANVAAVQALQDLNTRRTVILDDGSTRPWPSPTPRLSGDGVADTRRVGDTVSGISGILTHRFGAYRLDAPGDVTFTPANARPFLPPAVGAATLRVASLNVLNYFLSLGNKGRGASNAEELARQRAKTLQALSLLQADIVAIMEVERRPDNAALADLVSALNERAGAGMYAFVDSSSIAGTDAIQVALVYRRTQVRPIGPPKTDTSSGAAVHHRPPLAQTFEAVDGGERFTVVVNHLKSKSPADASGADLDQKDGQGAYNDTRRRQAAQVLAMIGDPVATYGDSDVLIVGDLNAYREEDPIDLLRAGGFEDLLARFQGEQAYSYVYAGQSGYLDHALASASLARQVTGAAQWHINADEPPYLDYNLENKSREQQQINAGSPYRSSDHDPVIVGLRLGASGM